jgi:heme-binding NEAT domain protein
MVTSMYVRKNAIARKSMSLILAASLAGGAMSTYAFADEAGDGPASGTIATQSLTTVDSKTYTVACNFMKSTDPTDSSMAANWVDKTATVTRTDASYIYDITTITADFGQFKDIHVTGIKYANASDEYVQAEVVASDDTAGTTVYRVVLDSLTNPVKIKVSASLGMTDTDCLFKIDDADFAALEQAEEAANQAEVADARFANIDVAIAAGEEAVANADKYTEDSIAAVQEWLDKAKNARAMGVTNSAMPQVMFDTIAANLQDAIKALKANPTAGGDETQIAHQLEDGIYAISVNMLKTNKSDASMCDNAINHTAKLEVADGKYCITLDFNGITIENSFGYLAMISYYLDGYTYNEYGVPQGELAAATVLSTQKNSDGTDVIDQFNSANALYPDIVTFELVSTARTDADGYAALQVYVPIMEDIATGNGTQNVLMKLDWDSVRATTADDPAFAPGEADDAALSPAVNVTDPATGITVNAAKGVLPEGAALVVSALTEGVDYATAQAALVGVANKFALYEVHFVDTDGQVVQPNGTVEVSYPIPADFDQTKVALYRINDDGTKTKIDGEVKDGKYVVNTKSFSKYALVELNAEGEAATAGATTLASGAATSLAGSATSSSLATTGDEAGMPVAPLAATAAGASLLAAMAAVAIRRIKSREI